MNSKRILTIFILFALLIATTSVAFASSDIDDADFDDDLGIDVDDSDYGQDDSDDQDDYYEDSNDDDYEDSDDGVDDDDSDDWDDDNSDDSEDDDESDDWDDDQDEDDSDDWDDDSDDWDDDQDEDDSDDWDDDSDDWDDDEDSDDWDDESDDWDDDFDESDDNYNESDELDDDFHWDTIEKRYGYLDGKLVCIYKTTAFYKGKTYAASSCSYIPNDYNSENYSENTEYYENETESFTDSMCGAESPSLALNDYQYDSPNVKSVSKSIDSSISVAQDGDGENTSVDTTDNTAIPIQSESDYGILGLLLTLILSVVLII